MLNHFRHGGLSFLQSALRAHLPKWRGSDALLLALALLLVSVALAPPASARTLRYRLQPGQDLPAETAAPVVVAQSPEAAATGALLGRSNSAPAQSPPGETAAPKPEAPAARSPSNRSDAPEQLSERAAAAAARAARALADEDGSQFEGNVPVQTELVLTGEAASTTPAAQPPQGQSVTPANQRRSTAAVTLPQRPTGAVTHAPAQAPAPMQPKASVTCVAGCY